MKKIVYAKQQGSYHIQKGIPCQDYVKGYADENVAVIALADGAGTYDNSEIVSESVVEGILNGIKENFDKWYEMTDNQLKSSLLNLCREAVWEKDAGLKAVCTLLLYAISSDGREIIAHIGDGFILGMDCKEKQYVISHPENGDEPSQTFFVSDKNALDHLRIIRNDVSNNAGVTLCSDGASAALIDRANDRVANVIRKLVLTVSLESEEKARSIVENTLDTMFRVHSHDDMSIGILINTQFNDRWHIYESEING